MRRVLSILIATILGVASLHGQATPGIAVSGQLVDGQGNIFKSGYLHFQLYNCGVNVPQVIGNPQAIVSQSFDIHPNPATGIISGVIFGANQISCGGVQSTQWQVTMYKASGQSGGQPQYYCLTSPGTFDPSLTQPCTVIPPPPGFFSLFANPISNQTWTQPTGTTGYLNGTFDFTGATINGFASGAQPSGPNYSLQYNNPIAGGGNTLGGDPNLLWNPITEALTIGTPAPGGTQLSADGNGFLNTSLTPDAADSSQRLATTSNIFTAHIPWANIANKPTQFPPTLPTPTTPGGVFMPANCTVGTHIYGIGSNGQLLCSNDLAPSLCLEINGGSTTLNTGTVSATATGNGTTITATFTGSFLTIPSVASTIVGSSFTQAWANSSWTVTASSSTSITATQSGVTTSFTAATSGSLVGPSGPYCGIVTLDFVGGAGMQLGLGYNQATGHLTLNVTGSTATQALVPTFNPLAGAYPPGQTVALACGSPTPTIYYTTNGTTPTHSSSVYSTPISVSTTTIEAICASSGLSDSNVVSSIYTIAVPVVSLNPSSLTFGTQLVGTPSYQPVTLTNTGNATLTITSITGSGDYTETDNCGSSLGASQLCTINVQFTPSAVGTRTGAITVTDNASDSPESVSLTGVGALPTATPSPTSLTFASQNLGTSSAPQTVTITNTAAVPLTVSSIGITGTNANEFTQSNTCTTVPPSGGTCTVNVVFGPIVAGAASASLTITDNAANSPQTVPLSGTGSQPTAPAVTLSPTSISFGTVKVNTSAGGQLVTLTNTGTANLTVSTVSIGGTNPGDFSVSSNCVGIVAAGGHCSITAGFRPTVVGGRTATILIADNASNSPQSVPLSGIGALPTVSLSVTSLSFGNQTVGTTSAAQQIQVTNTGVVPLGVNSISSGAPFGQTNNCGSNVAAGASCTINVTFSPTGVGNSTGQVTISDDAANSPQSVSLSGTGIQPSASISPTTGSW